MPPYLHNGAAESLAAVVGDPAGLSVHQVAPIRDEIGMNYGIGALGPYNHANVTIGRAYCLLSMNAQGGSEPGNTYMGSVGNNWNTSACFAENGNEVVCVRQPRSGSLRRMQRSLPWKAPIPTMDLPLV